MSITFKTEADAQVNINIATKSELETLPSIGPTRATEIITYRKVHKFKSVDELGKVPGIGPATLNAIKPLVKIS